MDLSTYFSFKGRLARWDFWLYYALPATVVVLVMNDLLPQGPAQIWLEAAAVLLILPGICERLHDLNHPLWPFAVIAACFAGAWALDTTGVSGDLGALIFLFTALVLAVYGLVILFIRGTKGPNRFGEDPLGGTQGE